MKTRAGYVIRQLADTFYIIPTGQRIADRRRCLKINQTGCVNLGLVTKGFIMGRTVICLYGICEKY